MPEGPEIRRTADQLGEALNGRVVEAVTIACDALAGHEADIVGHAVVAVDCHGKALLTRFSSGRTLYSHNQLYGEWRVVPRGTVPPTKRALRLAIHNADFSALLYSATDVSLWHDDKLHEHPFLARLGPDVLDPRLAPEQVVERLMSKPFQRRALATLLLDQGFLAGIGNYLRSEILFSARLSPLLRPVDLEPEALRILAHHILLISQRSYETGGVTNQPARAEVLRQEGVAFEDYRFMVFDRDGRRCYRCRSRILREVTAARRIYWCPCCQSPGEVHQAS